MRAKSLPNKPHAARRAGECTQTYSVLIRCLAGGQARSLRNIIYIDFLHKSQSNDNVYGYVESQRRVYGCLICTHTYANSQFGRLPKPHTHIISSAHAHTPTGRNYKCTHYPTNTHPIRRLCADQKLDCIVWVKCGWRCWSVCVCIG